MQTGEFGQTSHVPCMERGRPSRVPSLPATVDTLTISREHLRRSEAFRCGQAPNVEQWCVTEPGTGMEKGGEKIAKEFAEGRGQDVTSLDAPLSSNSG